MKMKSIVPVSELKVYTDEERMRRVHRNLMLSDCYQEFQNSVLFCTPRELRLRCAKIKEVTIPEIIRLSKIDLSNKVQVGKIYARYFTQKAADFYITRNMVEALKDAAKRDVKVLEMLSRYGINDLENWFYKQKYKMNQ